MPMPHEELLGMCLRDPTVFRDYFTSLDESHFPQYEWLYRKMKELDEADALTMRNIGEECREHLKTIQSLYNTVVSTRLAHEKVRQVKSIRLSEQMNMTFTSAMTDLQYGTEPDEVYRDTMRKMDLLQTSDVGGLIDTNKALEEWLVWLDEVRADPTKAFGLMTGLQDLDMVTTGFHRHDLSVVGARTSMGKSAFMIEMVLRLQKNGLKTAIFSLEMTRKQILNRMVANLCRIPLKELKQGRIEDFKYRMIRMERDRLEQIYVDDTRGVSADYITDSMRMLKRKAGLDFVVVDYLQDVKEKGEETDNQGSALARVCRKLRKGALDCDCHVMALSQVKREVENRNDKRPMNSDLSGSTGIETSADVIALLYRDEYYNPKTEKAGIIEVNFTKQRNGGVGRVELKYDKDIQRMFGLYER
jgi:replicative DNA helicase